MTDTKMVKSAGEHWVASVLAGLGWSAALTRDGVERTDILATHTASDAMIEVQVKAAGHSTRPNWRVNHKAQLPARSDREWFVFVALAAQPWEAHRGFVMPRDHANAAAWITHMEWLTAEDVPAGQRNTPVEQARMPESVIWRYENRWDLLLQPASHAPVLLPNRFSTLATSDRIGLPPGHPWLRGVPTWHVDPAT